MIYLFLTFFHSEQHFNPSSKSPSSFDTTHYSSVFPFLLISPQGYQLAVEGVLICSQDL